MLHHVLEELQIRILLSPGEFFSLQSPSTIWFRFNAAYAADAAALTEFLQSLR